MAIADDGDEAKTVSVMPFVAAPALLLATSEYWPWLEGYWTEVTVSALVVLPEMVSPLPVEPSTRLVPFNRHWSVGAGDPETAAPMTAVAPAATV